MNFLMDNYINQSPCDIRKLMNENQIAYFALYPNPNCKERRLWKNLRNKMKYYNAEDVITIKEIIKLNSYMSLN